MGHSPNAKIRNKTIFIKGIIISTPKRNEAEYPAFLKMTHHRMIQKIAQNIPIKIDINPRIPNPR